jgi:hypothetical protein
MSDVSALLLTLAVINNLLALAFGCYSLGVTRGRRQGEVDERKRMAQKAEGQ